MNRNESLKELRESDQWDIVIIGGGASGLGAVVDAAKRGYKPLLLEKNDFAKGTSSRSTSPPTCGSGRCKTFNVNFSCNDCFISHLSAL